MRSQHCFAILSYKCLIIFYSLWRRAEACNHWGHSLPHNQWLHHSQVIFSLGVDSCLLCEREPGIEDVIFNPLEIFKLKELHIVVTIEWVNWVNNAQSQQCEKAKQILDFSVEIFTTALACVASNKWSPPEINTTSAAFPRENYCMKHIEGNNSLNTRKFRTSLLSATCKKQ